jgi:hypothetical protein
MTERRDIGRFIAAMEQQMKELEIAYEQYFAGAEKREPLRDREALARRLRFFANRRIIQTDLRFRYQNLATRFHSYSGYWDRILRLMDEGRYTRHLSRSGRTSTGKTQPEAGKPAGQLENLYDQLVNAHRSCNLKAPERSQVEAFLNRQQETIREKFGDRAVEYQVETEGGKPRIKVKAKK